MPPKRKAAASKASDNDADSVLFESLVFTFTPAAQKGDDGKEATKLIKKHGGRYCGNFNVGTIVSTVSKKLTHLIALASDASAAKPPAKIRAAQEASDVAIVTPDFILESVEKDTLLDEKDFSAVAGTASNPKKKRKTAADEDEDDQSGDKEEEKDVKPAPRRSSRTAAAKAKKIADEEEEEAEDEAEQKKPAKRASRAKTKTPKDEDVEMDDAEQEEKEEKKPAGRASKAKGKKSKEEDVDMVDGEQEEEKEKKPTKGGSKAKGKKAKEDDEEEKEEEAPPPAQKIVKAIKKGRAAVDHKAPPHVQKSAHVLEQGDDVYDVLLNQTEIKNNNNKFYVLQLLQDDGGKSYYVFTRWGRVGADGQQKTEQFSGLPPALSAFKKKFHEKTKNNWDDRANFEKVPGKYFLLERDFSADNDDDDDDETNEKEAKEARKVPESKLEKPVQDLVKMIFNIDMMTKQMVEIGYDAKKMPLGKLSKANMQKGMDVLKEIAEVINNGRTGGNLDDLSSKFYTYIPHEFGMRRPPTINTKQMVKEKLEMLESLADIQIATTLLKVAKEHADENPIDVEYRSLKCALKPVEKGSDKWNLVEKYTKNTHAKTHSGYELDVEEIFEVDREGEDDRFSKGGAKLHNRKLLWHGSRLTNYAGILSQGLRIAPPEAPVTGYMFGKGVYFADMVSKSANYCFANKSNPTGLMMLCDVALGDQNKLSNADYYAGDTVQKQKLHSTMGVGGTMPDPKEDVVLDDGVVVPCGTGVPTPGTRTSLLYNEYIVYDLEQIKIRYLIKMNFKYKY
ncbi:Poly [ADP-ribose] polymerase 2 [Borealophlyctis nickersoniae]|nr:Poly [ADP-ribose] polymerase 2 [Borealophlyctis nickersoniae]